MIIALFLAAGMNFFSFWYADRIILRSYQAREATPSQNSGLYQIVNRLARAGNLPMPKIYIIPSQTPNAFATGRNPGHAVVAVTEGLIQLLNDEEIEGVLAHELSHVKHHDILIGTIVATMAGAIMILANMARWSAIFGWGASSNDNKEGGSGTIGLLIMSLLAPVAAALIQMAVSRSREYLADAGAADMVGNGESLAKALEKLGFYSGTIPMNASASTAHMFIVNPLTGNRLSNLFSTHPPLADRIARLRGIRPSSGHTESDRRRLEDAENFWRRLSR